MKGVILLNGEPPENFITVQNDTVVVCCDGALKWAKQKINKIDELVGDFDSLGYIPENAIVFPVEKDFTDGETALDILIKKGVEKVEIYGGGGGREDHFFGNMQLLFKAYKKGVKAVMHTAQSDIFCAGKNFELQKIKGKTFSLAPVGYSAHIINSSGVKYPLNNLTLHAGSCRGISNIALSDKVEVNCDRGALYVFVNKNV